MASTPQVGDHLRAGAGVMADWRNVVERRRIRHIVESLMKQAIDIGDHSGSDLRKAWVRVKGRRLNAAREASFDLGHAAHECNDPKLKAKIEEARAELDKLVF